MCDFFISDMNLGFPGGSDSIESACNAEGPGFIPGGEDPLEKGMATHSSILGLGNPRNPWKEEPGGLHPWGRKELDVTELLTLYECYFLLLMFLLNKFVSS